MANKDNRFKSSKMADKRVIDNAPDRKAALADPRMPDRVDTVGGKDWTLTRPKDIPGMNGRKITRADQLKAYIAKIPPAPSQVR